MSTTTGSPLTVPIATRRFGFTLLLSFACCACEQKGMGEDDLRAARGLTEEYQAALKSELMEAIGSGGPRAAVQVCNTKAPEIEQRLKKEGTRNSWTVKRTASRARNAQNMPHGEQVRGMGELQRRLSQGESPDEIEWHQSRGNTFIYMRPIILGDMCVICHGDPSVIPSDVKQVLAELYPKDEAVGFSPGDFRGAFVVTGQLSK